ncbi:MAG: hypothetical protein SGJ15_13470 [Bacteroidota bacterium]|nr:hypothetical protein [Bacteroidota bacterium]
MKSKYLFPNKWKKIGIMILVPGIILFLLNTFLNFEIKGLEINVFSLLNPETDSNVKGNFVWLNDNLTNEIAMILFIIGGILTAFSKEKNEDEFISKIRLDSLVWATYINYILLILSVIFFYGTPFLVIINLNMFTILVLFILRFNFILFQGSKKINNEKFN